MGTVLPRYALQGSHGYGYGAGIPYPRAKAYPEAVSWVHAGLQDHACVLRCWL